MPDDILRTKQLLGLTLYAERSHGSSAFAALARGLTAMLGGFYEIEGAYFTPEGETLGVPKRAARSRPEPPSPARVAKRALILCALAERWRALDTGDFKALEKIPPAVLLDPRGSGAEREARANAKRSVMAPVCRRALRWLRGDTISYADSATGAVRVGAADRAAGGATARLASYAPQHLLCFFPLPHPHGSLRPTFGVVRRAGSITSRGATSSRKRSGRSRMYGTVTSRRIAEGM